MNTTEANIMAADFYKEVKGLKRAYPTYMSYELTKNYLVLADHESINDKSEEYEVPAEYYALQITEPTNCLHIRCYNEHEEGPVFLIDDENTIFESEDQSGNLSREIADEIYNAIISIAEDFTFARCEDVEIIMVSAGQEAVLWIANGDSGYPATPAEYEGKCPHCSTRVTEIEGHCRCESCKKFYRITYDDCDW